MIYVYTVVLILILIGWSQTRTVNCFSISFQRRVQGRKRNIVVKSTDGTLLGSEDEIHVGFRVPSSFLKSNEELQKQLQNVDITQLKVDDPFFLLLPWPSDGGAEAKAYGRHFTWKRSLSDAERLRWEKWAMHQLTSSNDDPFQYQLEDYIKQNLWKSMETKAVELLLAEADQSNSHISSGKAISAGLLAYHSTEVEEATRAMTAYYQSFNFKNVEALLNFWLPNNYCELILPGFDKAKGIQEVDALYRKLYAEVRPFCSIQPHFITAQAFGNIVILYTLERRKKGFDYVQTKKVQQQKIPSKVPEQSSKQQLTGDNNKNEKLPERLLSMTVLRYANKLWRIASHHTVSVETAAFLGNALDVDRLLQMDKTSTELEPVPVNILSDTVPSMGNINILKSSVDTMQDTKKADIISELKRSLNLLDSRAVSNNVGKVDGALAKDTSMILRLPHPSQHSMSRLVLDAIQEIAAKGYISNREKGILLESVIDSMTRQEKSFVEVAFEVIFGVELKQGDPLLMDDEAELDKDEVFELEGNAHAPKRPSVLHRMGAPVKSLENFAQQCRVEVIRLEKDYPKWTQ